MTTSTWISRHSLGWLLAAQIALIAPHLPRLPLWISLAWAICALWRVQVYRGHWPFPNGFVKAMVVAASLAGIRLNYGSFLGLEPTVALLISCFSFKLVEAATRREAYLLLFLGYFVALTEFLFEQGLGTVLYMFVPVLLLTTALIALHQDDPLRFSWQPLRAAGAMSAQALPLLLLLFLVFPRMAPLWKVPLPSHAARTGMSDQMAPGDIAQLSQSDELAFRAVFNSAVPAPRELYWRGLVLDRFDGHAWRASDANDTPLQRAQFPESNASSSTLEYEILLEPTFQRWLYALQVPEPVTQGIVLTVDYRLLASDVIVDKFSYRARAHRQARLDRALDEKWRAYNLLLPQQNNNPRARLWARELHDHFGDDRALIDYMLATFRNQKYFYTLQPPLLGENSIDEFLFDTHRGFCEHYASSFVFVLRAAGIPARVVTGYQGGEINPLTGTVLVHQFDAHAWAEAWLPGEGWVRFDPTAFVAPQRIENGLERAVGDTEFLAQQPLSVNRFRGVGWLNGIRLRIDAINYAWARWVVNYRDETQVTALRALLGEINPLRMMLLLVGGGGVALMVVASILFGQHLFRERVALEQRYYTQFCARLAKQGYPRPLGMAPGSYARWILRQQPRWQLVQEVTRCFEALSYRRLPPAQREQLLKKLKRLVRSRDFTLP